MYQKIDILSDEYTNKINAGDRGLVCAMLGLTYYIDTESVKAVENFGKTSQEFVITAGEGAQTDVVFAGPVHFTVPLSRPGDALFDLIGECVGIYNGMGLDHNSEIEWIGNFYADWEEYSTQEQYDITIMYQQAYRVLAPLFDALPNESFEVLYQVIER